MSDLIVWAKPRANNRSQITGNLLRVYDEQDRMLGSEAVKPGDDVEAAARRILREKQGKHVRFYDRISYRGNVI